MRLRLHPHLWLSLSLLVVSGVGAGLLTRPICVHLSERDRTAYGVRPIWQAGFDALSATCGVGLLTYDLNQDYTPTGRWVLAALGLTGAVLYLVAARQALGRFLGSTESYLPPARLIVAAFLVLQVLAIVLFALVEPRLATGVAAADAVWNSIAVFASLGWLRETPLLRQSWLYAGVSLLVALGWSVWLLARPRHRRLAGVWMPGVGPSLTLRVLLGTYAAFLLLSAALIAGLEVPRGPMRQQASPDQRLTGQDLSTRYARSLAQVVCAVGAGLPTEKLADRNVSEGTKLVLAGVVLVGGLGGSVGGGIKWPLLLWALAAGGLVLGRGPGRSGDELTRRCLLAGSACAATFMVLALVVALGLLLIEAHTGSPYQSAPTLADALLDASSAVGGANLSSGLTATVSNRNLSSGIRQSTDLYQYGMGWLMLAMLIGRIVPVLVLARLADFHPGEPERWPSGRAG
jgi:hypothetical protein